MTTPKTINDLLLAHPEWVAALASAVNCAPFDIEFALNNQVEDIPLPGGEYKGGTYQGYVSGDREFLYPGAGDKPPPGGAKVHLLTTGGICIDGSWPTAGCMAWAPLPKRNKDKERQLTKG